MLGERAETHRVAMRRKWRLNHQNQSLANRLAAALLSIKPQLTSQ
jgi:hypothetical protein